MSSLSKAIAVTQGVSNFLGLHRIKIPLVFGIVKWQYPSKGLGGQTLAFVPFCVVQKIIFSGCSLNSLSKRYHKEEGFVFTPGQLMPFL